jgi:hypothetical protein
MVIHWKIRESLRDFGRQYRRYGRGKAAMVRKNGLGAVRPRHLAAPALVVMLSSAAVAGSLGRRGTATALAGPYLIALAVAARWSSRSARVEVDAVRLAGAFATMHLEGIATRAAPTSSSLRHRS